MAQNANETAELQDRRDIPVFIHRELDDLGLSPNAFRLYCHLARRAGSGMAWPSYQSMGDHCFMGQAEAAGRRNIAIKAMKDLVDQGLIKKVTRRDGEKNETNLYYLTPRSEWGGGIPTILVSPQYQGGIPTIPKGTPSEGTPSKDQEEEVSLGDVFKAWGNVLPGFNYFDSEALKAMVDDYQAVHVLQAIKDANKHGVKTIAYVEGILKRRANGTEKKEYQSSGGGRAGNKDADADTQRANAMYGERKKVVVTMPDLPDDPGF